MTPIIDAHHHLWEPGDGRYPWMQAAAPKFMGDTRPVCRPYRIEDLCAEAERGTGLRLAGSVHLQCGRNPARPAEETAWVQAQADRRGLPVAIVGHANLADPALDALLDAHAASAGFRGVRQMLNWHDSDERLRLCDRGDYLRDAQWQAGFARLGARGLSFDLQVNPWQLPAAYAVASAHPDTVVVINHAGLPFADEAARRAWRTGMAALGGLPQVHVKFSGLGMVDPGWTAASVQPLFDTLLECFGPHRMMFGSNFPIDRLYRRYAEVYAHYAALCAHLDAHARNALFHANARRVYRIDTPSSTAA
ncbi:MAG: amidohydrolase family protein [Variovorax sp.]|nr:amidohydrolase family protein [Variovorax sp.]